VNDFPPESEEHLYGLDTWVVDCNCLTNTDKSHSYVEKSVAWAQKFKPKKTYLTHLDYTIDYDSVSKMLPAGMELAYDGLVIEL
jgi:phosphoribosyl 1,2-cyclic phosphate phosphodiesterase